MDCWTWLITAISESFTSSTVRNRFSFLEVSLQLVWNLLTYARILYSFFSSPYLMKSSSSVVTDATKKSLVFIYSLVSGSGSKWILPLLFRRFIEIVDPEKISDLYVSQVTVIPPILQLCYKCQQGFVFTFVPLINRCFFFNFYDTVCEKNFEPMRFISNVLKH